MEIVQATAPGKLAIKLDFITPFEAHNLVDFSLVAQGNVTQVTLAMHGPSPLIS